jgi:tubulin polyglutamylase TTLL6/13
MKGHDVNLLKSKLYLMFAKLLASVAPKLNVIYNKSENDSIKTKKCFHILGIDVLIDDNLNPWLIEVNHTPSFTTDSPFDYRLKFNLIKDTIRLIRISP